jgi:hypothetical protein
MKEQIDKIKRHIRKYRVAYSCTVTTLVVAGITATIMRERYAGGLGSTALGGLGSTSELGKVQSRSLIFSLFNSGNSTAVTSIHTGKRGSPGYVTRNLETGHTTSTQTAMAKEFNIPRSLLSDHLNGKLPDVDGFHFERILVA